MMRSLVSLGLLAVLAPTLSADVRLPALIGDHMVLQQDATVNVWGWADPEEEVRVTASWTNEQTKTVDDESGRWQMKLETAKAGGPHHLHINGDNELHVTDILFGEVWVCGGQSNMAWSMARCAPLYEEERASANHPNIRLFNVGRNVSAIPVEDAVGEWLAATPSTVTQFSAVGFFFGRNLTEELDVPIGLISCNWGGTLAEAWTSEKTLRRWSDFNAGLDVMAKIAADPSGQADSVQARKAKWWSKLEILDKGSHNGWSGADFDSSSWGLMQQPNDWTDTELAGHDGIVWLRKTFQASDDVADQTMWLELGAIDDMDTTWVNGVRVGGYEDVGHHGTYRRYEVPAGVVVPGENTIAVRVLDTGGPGGLTGNPEHISICADNKSRSLPLDGRWDYMKGAEMRKLSKFPQTSAMHQNMPTALSNGMLSAITNFTIRGAIWYQGESNRTRAALYEELFPGMIADWRERWGQGDFPFYFVQIAPYNYGGDTGQAAHLRDSQRKTLSVPNTGMAVTMDIGNPKDIHPKNKLDVGKRLALWALAKTYGKPLRIWSGPLYRSVSVEKGALRVHFDQTGIGLATRDAKPLSHFQVAGADRVFHSAEARLDGKTVVVSSSAVSAPVAVRYGWGATDEPNLMNKAGLPASSFRSDDW
jgi:sialate O-acetylesterase